MLSRFTTGRVLLPLALIAGAILVLGNPLTRVSGTLGNLSGGAKLPACLQSIGQVGDLPPRDLICDADVGYTVKDGQILYGGEAPSPSPASQQSKVESLDIQKA